MKTLLYGGPVFTSLGDQLENAAILINGEKIESVGSYEQLLNLAPDAIKMDVKGKTILPGMVDAHRHIIAYTEFEVTPGLIVTGTVDGVRVAREAIEMGLTTVRDPGCKHYGIFEMVKIIDSGALVGPNIYPAGPNPTGSAAPQSWRNVYVNGPWQMRQAVRELVRDGAYWIKLVVSGEARETGWKRTDWFLTPEEIQAATDEAHACGKRISGHVEALDAANAVVDAGFDAIEHGTVIDQKLAEKMAKKGVCYVPTLFAFSKEMAQWDRKLALEEVPAFKARVERHLQSFRYAIDAGVRIAVGTDFYRFQKKDCFVQELKYMLAGGMSNAAVLRAATAVGAAVLGEEDKFGTLTPGKRADIIAVDGNPLTEIESLLKVDLVIKKGMTLVLNGVGLPVNEVG